MGKIIDFIKRNKVKVIIIVAIIIILILFFLVGKLSGNKDLSYIPI